MENFNQQPANDDKNKLIWRDIIILVVLLTAAFVVFFWRSIPYSSVDDFADADQKKFALEIKSAGFYNAKSKNIIAACKMIRKDFGGKLPKTMHEIMRLPGVARKTASIVLGNAYGVVEGIAVDTHVRQFANYCALSFERDPVKIEQDLMKVIPKKEWFNATYRIIGFNREMRSRASREAAKLKIVLQDLCPASPI